MSALSSPDRASVLTVASAKRTLKAREVAMARQVGRAKATKARATMPAAGRGTPSKSVITRKRRSRVESSAPARVARLAETDPLVEKIMHEIFQTRAAYRADLFAYEADDGLSK
jgi:hypothetical protein